MAEEIMEVSNENWQSAVDSSMGVVVVYFWAPWCGHCKMYEPVFDEIAAAYDKKAKFMKLNCDLNTGLAIKCQIKGTPTTVIYRNAVEVDRVVGGIPKELMGERIDRAIAG